MILTCAQCKKRYMIEDESLGPEGRKVRCVACGHTWQQSVAVKPAIPKVLGMNHSAAVAVETSVGFSGKMNFIICAFATVLLLGGMIVAREPITQLWPSAKSVYRQIGFSVLLPGDGLVIKNRTPDYVQNNGRTYMTISAEVMNKSSTVQPLAPIVISLQGDCEYASWWQKISAGLRRGNLCTLKKWQHHFVESRLLPGERLAFETKQRPLHAGAKSIVMGF